MAILNVYLNFPGNTEEAFNFYKSVFGGEFTMLQRFKDTPHGEKMAPNDLDKIMHVRLNVGKDMDLMGSDNVESASPVKFVAGNNFSISVQAESKEEADKIFNGLAAGGKVDMPLQDTFWKAYFGMLKDKFGIAWMINYQYPEV